jgi:hypothetical protein
MPELDLTALRNFGRHAEPEPLRTWFMLPVRYELLEYRSPSPRWGSPAELRGRHIIHLSRIGFSDDFSQALVSVEERQEGNCSEGYYLLLDRSGSFWRLVQKLTAWMT